MNGKEGENRKPRDKKKEQMKTNEIEKE